MPAKKKVTAKKAPAKKKVTAKKAPAKKTTTARKAKSYLDMNVEQRAKYRTTLRNRFKKLSDEKQGEILAQRMGYDPKLPEDVRKALGEDFREEMQNYNEEQRAEFKTFNEHCMKVMLAAMTPEQKAEFEREKEESFKKFQAEMAKKNKNVVQEGAARPEPTPPTEIYPNQHKKFTIDYNEINEMIRFINRNEFSFYDPETRAYIVDGAKLDERFLNDIISKMSNLINSISNLRMRAPIASYSEFFNARKELYDAEQKRKAEEGDEDDTKIKNDDGSPLKYA